MPLGTTRSQALAIEIDDPEDLPQLLQRFFAQGLPHVSLIQLGVAHQGNEAVRPGVPEMVAHKLSGQPGEVGDHRSQTHRTGGKVDLVHVLGAAGIGLKSLEAAELAELLLWQVAQEILDGVVHRGAVGFDRDPVSKSQRVEIEGRHQADHGGATGLVAPHLGAGAVFPQGIGVMHDLHAQPQNPILNLLQDGDLRIREVLGKLQADPGSLVAAGESRGISGHSCTRSP